MKALTLWQPWASLVALGVKSIETRSWSTSYRGPLAIHAAKREPDVDFWVGHGAGLAAVEQFKNGRHLHLGDVGWTTNWHPLPLGAVVATVKLVDVVPILAADDSLDQAWMPHVAPTRQGELWHWQGPSETESLSTGRPGWKHAVIEDQLPYGDFAPGRYAWLLADVEPLAEPIPAKGRQGLWEWTR